MIGKIVKDAYRGRVRTGTVVEDLESHWRVDWGPNRTTIRKDRVGDRPKKQGPWWDNPAPPRPRPVTKQEQIQRALARTRGSAEHARKQALAAIRDVRDMMDEFERGLTKGQSVGVNYMEHNALFRWLGRYQEASEAVETLEILAEELAPS